MGEEENDVSLGDVTRRGRGGKKDEMRKIM